MLRRHTQTVGSDQGDTGLRQLLLNGQPVGTIQLLSHDGPWHFGEFSPGSLFSEFAPLFGRWSILMHFEGNSRLSRDASQELRETENAIDMLHAVLAKGDSDEPREIRQLNIDGSLIEWCES